MPERDARKQQFAPNDVMLDLLESLEPRADMQDLRYVLALLLIRRRVVRLEETVPGDLGQEVSLLYCPRRETTYRVPVATPSTERGTVPVVVCRRGLTQRTIARDARSPTVDCREVRPWRVR